MLEFKDLSSDYIRTPLSGWSSVPPSFGDEFYSLDGAVIRRGGELPINKRLPVLINNLRTAVGDMIPSTSWGSSLYNLLTKSSWDKLRHPLIENNSNVCELCGLKHRVMDVHEIWSYSIPEVSDHRIGRGVFPRHAGIQKLNGLMTLCHECHKCFHLGKAGIDGEFESVTNRLAAINNWGSDQLENYLSMVDKRWKLLSKFNWVLDFSSLIHPDGVFTIKSPWLNHSADDRFLTAPNRFGPPSVTAIIGHPWKLSRDDGHRMVKIDEIAT